MAKWHSNRLQDGSGVALSYTSDTGQSACCGIVPPETSDGDIVGWFLLNPQGANIGDLIILDGKVLQVFGHIPE